MVKCDFCGYNIEPGTGKMYVKTDGKMLWFCSNKCEKNTIKLGRTAIKTKWSKRFRK